MQSRPIVAKSRSEALRSQAGTPPPARSRRSRSQFVIFMNFVMSCIVFATLAAGAAVYYGKVQFEGQGPSTTTQTVLIRPNTARPRLPPLSSARGSSRMPASSASAFAPMAAMRIYAPANMK
jgi:UPF0755 protein